MLETIAMILVLLWLIGFVTAFNLGGFINLLLVGALIMVTLRVFQSRHA
jgi:Family of unknown function (DUF5670)